MNRSLYVSIALLCSVQARAVDLNQYPHPIETAPVAYSSLTPQEKDRTKPLTTDYVDFLFVSSCEPDGSGSEQCLWAFVQTLFESRIAIERDEGAKSVTLHRVRVDADFKSDSAKVRQFVLVERGTAEDLTVNGKSIRVTEWAKLADSNGQLSDPSFPMVWLPVTADNQNRINAEYYQGLRTGPKEVKLLYQDLQAAPGSMGKAYFVVVGLQLAAPNQQNQHFVASKHAIEPDVFTAKLKRVAYENGAARVFDWMGYTFTTSNERLVEFEALRLDQGPAKASFRGKIGTP